MNRILKWTICFFVLGTAATAAALIARPGPSMTRPVVTALLQGGNPPEAPSPECSDCPPPVPFQLPGYAPGWPALPECANPLDVLCYYGPNTPSIEASMVAAAAAVGQGTGGWGCLYFIFNEGGKVIATVCHMGYDPVPPDPNFNCDTQCTPPPGVIYGPIKIPWVDVNGDGFHHLDDKDGSTGATKENDSPYAPGSGGEALNDSDGDGIPDGIDGNPDDECGAPFLVPNGFKNPPPGANEHVKEFLKQMGYAIEDPDSVPPDVADLNGDNELSIHELAKAFQDKYDSRAAEIKQSTSSSDEEKIIDFGKLDGLMNSLGAVYKVLFGSGSFFSKDPDGYITYARGSVAAVEESHTNSSAVTIGLATGWLAATSQFYLETARHPDGSPGTSVLQLDGAGGIVPDGTESSPQRTYAKSKTSSVSDPVSTANGEYFYHKEDLVLRGTGMDLRIERYYRSRDIRSGVIGPNWSMPLLETHLAVWGDVGHGMLIEANWGDGTRTRYQKDMMAAEPIWIGTESALGKVRITSAGYAPLSSCDGSEWITKGFTLRNPDGTEYLFCPPVVRPGTNGNMISYLREVRDINNNSIYFKRNAMGRVETIVDTNQNVVELEYDADGWRLEAVEDWTGRRVEYEYDEITGDLVRVSYPSVEVLDATETCALFQPYEEYTYWQSSSGYEVDPDLFLNHNLKSIQRGDAGVMVEIDYHTGVDYEFDRVKTVEVGGHVATFSYSSIPIGTDPHEPKVTHRTRTLFANGEQEDFYHGEGLLYRHELLNGRVDSSGALIAGSADPSGPSSWWTVYEYNQNLDPLSVLKTTPGSNLRGRKTVYLYDDQNPDRFQHGNIRQIERHGDTADGGPPKVLRSMLYEPITCAPYCIVDEIGRETVLTYSYQELEYSAVQSLPRVAGWGIVDYQAPGNPDLWSQAAGGADINGDGVKGGAFAVIKSQSPAIDIDSPAGPSGTTLTGEVPVELYRYDRSGRIRQHEDAGGVWTNFFYSGPFLSRTVRDSGGVNVVRKFTHDSLGRQTRVQLADGRRTMLFYDALDRLVAQGQVEGGTGATWSTTGYWTRFMYDSAGEFLGTTLTQKLESFTVSAVGQQPSMDRYSTFSSSGKETQRRLRRHEGGQVVDEGTIVYGYDERDRLVSESLAGSYSIATTRNSKGWVTQRVVTDHYDSSDLTSSYEYNDYGELTKEVAPVGMTTYRYDGLGRMVESLGVDGITTLRDVDDAGRPYLVRMYDGTTEVFNHAMTLDAMGRVRQEVVKNFLVAEDGTVSVGSPADITTNYGWGIRRGSLLWTDSNTSSADDFTRNVYDSLGRRTEVWTGAGSEFGTVWGLDAEGKVATLTNRMDSRGHTGALSPSESAWVYTYNTFGQVESIADPLGRSRVLEYGDDGLLEKETLPGGKVLEFVRDSHGNAVESKETGPGGQSRTSLTKYGLFDQALELTDPVGNVTAFVLDGMLRPRRQVYADQKETTRAYDAEGRLASVAYADGSTVTYGYDSASRLASLNAAGGDQPVIRSYDYGPLGGLRRVEETVGSQPLVALEYRRSVLGWVESESTVFSGSTDTFTYSREAGGRVSSIQFPSGHQFAHGYDLHGRLKQVDSSIAQTLFTVDEFYGPADARRSTLAGGAVASREFDAIGKSVESSVLTSGGTALIGDQLTWDAAGNLTERVDLVSGRLEEFDYDDFDHLIEWRWDATPGGSAGRIVDWDWDPVERLQSYSDTSGIGIPLPQSNNLNQTTAAAPVWGGVDYDDRGQEYRRTDSAGNERTIEWDSLGRPISALLDDPSGSGVSLSIDWIFDPLDRMIQRSDSSGDTVHVRYNGSRIASVTENTGVTREYFHGKENITWQYDPVAGGKYIYVDPLGNVGGRHDGSALLDSWTHEPYGRPLDRSTGAPLIGSGLRAELGLLGKLFDFDMGGYVLGPRILDSGLGQFTSRDPLGESASTNLYSYGWQNPLRWADPTGLCSQDTDLPHDFVNELYWEEGDGPGFSYTNVPRSSVEEKIARLEAEMDAEVAELRTYAKKLQAEAEEGDSDSSWGSKIKNGAIWGVSAYLWLDRQTVGRLEAGAAALLVVAGMSQEQADGSVFLIGMAIPGGGWRRGVKEGLEEGLERVVKKNIDEIVERGARVLGHNLDDLSRAAGAMDKNGLTVAGRALQKHSARPGSAFAGATGSAASRNAAGQSVVDDILTSPGTTFSERTTGRFGKVLDAVAPDGRGVRFNSDGRMIGLLEPPR